MQGVIRTYTGQPGLGRRLSQKRKDIEDLLSKVQGFIAYYLVDTPDGAVSVTLCRSREGVDESIRVASGWMRQNMKDVKPPEVTIGDVVIDLTGVHAR
jgi:hypothetical protein